MIRVSKSDAVPTSLSTSSQYKGEDVVRQLCADQHQKCYLCERTCITDYEVEHWHSKANYPSDRQNWRNLLLACSYCNGKKSNDYDDIVDPTHVNVEKVISQRVDYVKKKAVFTTVATEPAFLKTIELLERIHNGAGNMRKVREERFFERFVSEMNKFNNAILNYLQTPTEAHQAIVEELLGIDQEFLGFKYWMIKDNADLTSTFVDCCVWNKVEALAT